MAFSPSTWTYDVFTSFHGDDVRNTFLSHLREKFDFNGITMFDDQGMERSQIITPALIDAIRKSRISIIVLSEKYASSIWCLNELLEIMKCKDDAGRIVMTVFYRVDPSDVRKQTGDFGMAFDETCARKTKEEKIKWSQALTYVGNIAGEHFQNWNNEAEKMEKLVRDVSDKLNTPSRDFEGMVGLEAHLTKMESLLDLYNNGVKIVGISGPAGIGKSTIARALYSRLSNQFSCRCFMDSLRGINLVEYSAKLRLHTQLLSALLNQVGIRVDHLGVMKEKLHGKKVLIILDDVEHLDQLEELANIECFGPGSRIIVTTENKEILQQHRISDNDIHHVGFPSRSEALKIFCLAAFRQTSPPVGYMDLADNVARICGHLPLGLQVLGSSLRGKSRVNWMVELKRLKNRLDGRIERVLKVGYENLHEDDQSLFLFIAVFFNNKHVDHVTSMLANNNDTLNIRVCVDNLANRCLINYENSAVVMHHLLQVMARQIIPKQEPWKPQILVDAKQIFYVLENAEGNGSIVGISFEVPGIKGLKISTRAFEKMHNLFFLVVKNDPWKDHGRTQVHISEDMEFLPPLRLLHWEAYPGKSLPSGFCPENLIELDMKFSELEKLWEGIQPLANLKKMDLSCSDHLKELPNLSNAINLESLNVSICSALVELPPSISKLHKLEYLGTSHCESLEVIPTLASLRSLKSIVFSDGPRMRNFPNIPSYITELTVTNTLTEELPASIMHCSRLEFVDISSSRNLKTFLTHLPTSVTYLNLSNSGIESITDSIKGLHNLQKLDISDCERLMSLPELPCSLKRLVAHDCGSLVRVSGPLNTPNAKLYFNNCFNLDPQAQQAIIQRPFDSTWAVLPGGKVPAEFNHRGRGNSLTIPHSAFNRFKVCVVILDEEFMYQEDDDDLDEVVTDQDDDNDLDEVVTDQDDDNEFDELIVPELLGRRIVIDLPLIRYHIYSEHLLIFQSSLPFIDPSEVSGKIVLQFKTEQFEIIECGIEILKDETEGNNNGEDKGSHLSDTHKSDEDEEVSDKEDNESKSGEASDKKDEKEEYESESGEASKDKYVDIANDGDYESVSRKRLREMTSEVGHPKTTLLIKKNKYE